VLRIVFECGSRPDREKGEKYRPLALMRDAALSQNKAALRPIRAATGTNQASRCCYCSSNSAGHFSEKLFCWQTTVLLVEWTILSKLFASQSSLSASASKLDIER